MGNIVSGHELISRVSSEEVFGLTMPLVTSASGDKFGKTAGNAIWITPSKTSPFELYQFFLRSKDSEIEQLLRYFTFYSPDEISKIMEKQKVTNVESYLNSLPLILFHNRRIWQNLKERKFANFSWDFFFHSGIVNSGSAKRPDRSWKPTISCW